MTAEAAIGNDFRFQVGDGATPTEGFTDMCAVVDFGELGEEKALLDITTLCSEGREYRNGLADGLEIPLVLNFVDGDGEARSLYEDYKADRIRNFRIVLLSGSPTESFLFGATVRAWKIGAPVGDKASVTFTLKISGAVVWDY